jgi:hypothetical protein
MDSSRARVRPLRVRYWDHDLQVTARHVIGYTRRCECGERSPVCASYAMARGWLAEHKRGCKSG